MMCDSLIRDLVVYHDLNPSNVEYVPKGKDSTSNGKLSEIEEKSKNLEKESDVDAWKKWMTGLKSMIKSMMQ